MDIDFWIPKVIHALSLNFSLCFESFLLSACKSRSKLNLSRKLLKDLSMSLLSMPNVWPQSIEK